LNHNLWFQTTISYPPTDPTLLQGLSIPVTDKEIEVALFSMSPWKAPGPDGYPAGFFQKSWPMVKKGVCDYIKHLWANPHDVAQINKTDICLIPKFDKVEFVNQFRPISLCNVIYKILTKTIVNRLKPIIPNVISPYQTGFIPGRDIHENIIIAQEVVHSMKRMKGKNGFFMIKVDLSKAYDKLNWTFISNFLTELNIPTSLLNIIMNCIVFVESNVLWNGERTEFFHPGRGIRQGDPLSPYLFVFAIERSTLIIKKPFLPFIRFIE